MRTTVDFARQSRRLATLFEIGFWFGAIGLFAEGIYRPLKMLGWTLSAPGWDDVSGQLDLLLTAVLPGAALLAALWQARQLFRIIATGEPLSAAAAGALKAMGGWLAAGAVLAILLSSEGSPPSEMLLPMLSAKLLLGCLGLAIRTLGSVLDHAAAIKADHDRIV